MAKAFALHFDYTPKWKGNRTREEADRVTVRLRDFPESKKIALIEELQSGNTDAAMTVMAAIDLRKNNFVKSVELVKKQLISVSNLVIETGAGEKEIKTAEDISLHCEDLALELAQRLTFGADEEEIKNS
jgi:hypothetical protein